MYTIYVYDSEWKILHNPILDQQDKIVIKPVLDEKLNTHGSLQFTVPPTNPFYDTLEERKTKIKVVTDTKGRKPWFGRVMHIEDGWNGCLKVFCEGEFGCFNDTHVAPFGFRGTPADLLAAFVNSYNGSHTNGYVFAVGNVSVTDPNNYIARSSNTPKKIWTAIKDGLFGSSLGGYLIPRYDAENDVHYIDYLSLDDNDVYAHISSQVVKFGQNLLDFKKFISADEVATVLVPYGAQYEPGDPNYHPDPPQPSVVGSLETYNGNRLRLADDPQVSNVNYVINQTGVDMWGRIVDFKIWDDVTVASNLKRKADAWLAQQIWGNVSIEMNAVDLSFINADIEQIQIGDYVRVQSKPHDLNVLLLCTEKTTYLTQLEKSSIILGAGQKTITDLQAQSQMKEANN